MFVLYSYYGYEGVAKSITQDGICGWICHESVEPVRVNAFSVDATGIEYLAVRGDFECSLYCHTKNGNDTPPSAKALQYLIQMDTDLGIFDEILPKMTVIEAANKLHKYLLWAKLAGKSAAWLEDTEELTRWSNHASINLQAIIDCWE
jgi:hypothetical protein